MTHNLNDKNDPYFNTKHIKPRDPTANTPNDKGWNEHEGNACDCHNPNDKGDTGSYQDGLEDGQQVGLFMAYRIIKAEKKLHAYNSGAGRVLKTLEAKLKKQVGEL